MTYVSGGLIDDSDYNGFMSGVNGIWADTNGYGQPGFAYVSSGSAITASQWQTLFNGIYQIAGHQGTGIQPMGSPSQGQVIPIYNNIQSNISFLNAYRLYASSNGPQYVGWTGTNSKTSNTGAGLSEIIFRSTITWVN